MRTLLIPILAILPASLAPCGRAQSQQPPLSPNELREMAKENEMKQDELVNLEKETARALQGNSVNLFRQSYGDDFTAILPTGQTVDKGQWIAAIENSDTKYTSFVASDIRVRMFEDTAVVTCLWSLRGTRSGRTFAQQLRVTHVYVYGQRGWQAIAAQETLLPG